MPPDSGSPVNSDIPNQVRVDALRELATRHPISHAAITTTIAANATTLRCIKIEQPADDADLLSVIERELTDENDEPNGQMQIRCQELELEDEDDGQVSLVACSVPEEELARKKKLFEAAELSIEGMEVDALGLYNMLTSFGWSENGEATGLVHIGSQHTLCILTQPGTVPFFNVIEVAGSFLTERIMFEHQMDVGVAEKFKRKMFKPQWMRHPAFKASQLQISFDEFTDHLAKELKGNFLHYQATQGTKPVQRVYLTGGGARLDSLVQTLEEKLSTEIKPWDPFDDLADSPANTSDSIALSAGLHFALAFGVTQGRGGS